MKCPKCGSERTITTNPGKRALAWGAAGVTFFASSFVTRYPQGPSRAAGRAVCPSVYYICLNCKHEFSKGPDM